MSATAESIPGGTAPGTARPLLQLNGVTKRFGALTACDGVDLSIHSGQVLVVLGENGAGKSTLMKTVFGVHQPDAGQITLDGQEMEFASPRGAMAARIGMVFQTFALIPALSVRENLALAWPASPWNLGRRGRRASGALAHLTDLASAINPDALIEDLSVAEQQLVEISKVLNLDARLVILDEPTAVLTPAEARRLHAQIRRLADAGVAVVIITHKLNDVDAVGDAVLVMRRGKVVASGPVTQFDKSALVTAMVGVGVVAATAPPPLSDMRAPRLVLSSLSADGPRGRIDDITLSIASGEIVGIAGVSGNGQSALAEAVAGVLPVQTGNVLLDGSSIARRPSDPPKPLALGYIPEDPRENAVAGGLSLALNLGLRQLAAGSRLLGNDVVAKHLTHFDVRPPEPWRKANTLSGGNLQKLVVAREFALSHPAILLAFPTMGLDIRASAAVYAQMTRAAQAGSAILWISEEIDDLLSLSHRIAVLFEGRIVADLPNDGKLDKEALGAFMTGLAG